MRVFLTGASGFIGRRLLPVLRAGGCEVTALLRTGEVNHRGTEDTEQEQDDR
jgi:nucleoside-diphosphate-sugar epimerase